MEGVGLIDSTIYGRTYDQQQWENAFGLSYGAAPQDPEVSSYGALYRWYNCAEPPAADTIELVYPIPSFFYSILQGVGPDLTHENFAEAAFNADPTARGVTVPSLSWGGPEKGRWDEPDYQGVDDGTEIWWDPDASGPDETGTEGTGMYRYVDGGERYLPGEWPEEDPDVFVEEGSVTIYDEPPEAEVAPDYPSPCENG
ncbi:MAG: hypothetical protein U5R31_00345 [Acidimicrobiia bacterium]|nr:hypothetical protein [Acidimicrobiia bacterium]